MAAVFVNCQFERHMFVIQHFSRNQCQYGISLIRAPPHLSNMSPKYYFVWREASDQMIESKRSFFLLSIVPLLVAIVFACSSPTTQAMKISGKAAHECITAGSRVAIIGGGAGGLACARVFNRSGAGANSSLHKTVVLERDHGIGGTWNYRERDAKHRPMYRGLRTNLPKEVMAYREFPWSESDEPDVPSYVTHRHVQRYLEQYARKFDINVHLGCEVTQLTVLPVEEGGKSCFSPSSSDDVWPKVELTWLETVNNNPQHRIERKDRFDAVLVANGHYNDPRIPEIPGLHEHFDSLDHKRVLHAVEYDDPTEFIGQTVLCIGGRASGSDIARELAAAGATRVYLSDSSRTTGATSEMDKITWVPKTIQVLPGGVIEFDSQCPLQAHDIDTVIFCTGYDYSFPFINQQSRMELQSTNRRVTPLYEQLWHARYPHIAFVGLPHSIVPFPMFELQAEACLGVWQSRGLPSLTERLAVAASVATSGGEGKVQGRIEDTHYLGDAQWDYFTRLAQYAQLHDSYIDAFESYLRVTKVSSQPSLMRC